MNKLPTKSNNEEMGAIILCAFLSVLVYLANSISKGPMIQADEGSYLANAAAIAGYVNDMASSYHAGYSLLLAPAFLDGAEPATIWNRVKIINAVLFGLSVYLTWVLSNQWRRDFSFYDRAMAVTAVAAYPMWVVLAGYSFSQIAFVPFSILIAVLIFNAVDGRSIFWALVGLVAGFMYWIHPTGVVAIIAATMTLVYLAIVKKRLLSFAFYLLAVSLMIVGYKFIFSEWLHGRMTIGGPLNAHYPSASKLLLVLGTADGFKRVMSVLGGHVFYITAGSLGLVVVGMVALCRKFLMRKEKDVADSGYAFSIGVSGIYVFLSIVGVLIVSSVFMARAIRLDHWIYGRYVEGFIAPALLAALLFFSKRGVLLGAVSATLGAILLALGLGDHIHTAPFNVTTFWQEFYIRNWGVWGWLLASVFLMLLFIILPRKFTAIIAIVFFSFCTANQLNYHAKESEIASVRWEGARYVRENFPLGSCVGFDHSGINDYYRHIFWFDFSFQLYNYTLRRIGPSEWLRQCDGPLFSYSKNIEEISSHAHIVKISPRDGPFLWSVGQPYPINVVDRRMSLIGALAEGWHSIENTHVWSHARSTLRLPSSDGCTDINCKAILKFNVFGASPSRPVILDIYTLSDKLVGRFSYTSGGPFRAILPLSQSGSEVEYILQVDNAISPKVLQGSVDSRVLGIALISIDLQKDK